MKKVNEKTKRAYVAAIMWKEKRITEVANELGVTRGTVYNWIKEYRTKNKETGEIEIRSPREIELEKQVKELKEEVEFLKKARAYFTRDHKKDMR